MSNTILIVDDEPINLAVMEVALKDDYRLVFARNGLDAMAAALKHLPALILLDIQMPDMNGYAVCHQLKADPRTEGIPVIFISGLADAGHEEEGFACGAVDYIHKPISRAILRARVQTHLSLVRASRLDRSYREAIHMLGEAGHFNDNDTGVHIWRMAAYAGLIASAYGLEKEQCELIELAAPMHDTGKIGIPHAILKKPGKLDADEWTQMKTHSRIGYDILSKSDAPIFQMAATIALHHHERWDGSGYPDQLAGLDIPVAARVVALADVFDALSMSRPYKPAWPEAQVIATIRASAGSHFEPAMVQAFDAVLDKMCQTKADWDFREQQASW
ncbi:HD domain-containing phosphohydrolase [Rhodoferax sp. U2-2l]|uniref:response regulator n=1 Tax=Rhodoferax sp. U2-2l TaxID=2884000 RepID=UPI00351CDB55